MVCVYGVIQCKMRNMKYTIWKRNGKIHFNIIKLILLVENKVNIFLIYFYFFFEMFPD